MTQIDWRNHFYAISHVSCPEDGSLTVKNGTGITSGTSAFDRIRVDVVKTVFADFTRDGVQDVAVLLRCSRGPAPHIDYETSYEIQVFTRDGKPLGRLAAPPAGADANWWGTQFSPSEMYYQATDEWGGHHLVTGVDSWDDDDLRCCPSIHETYIWTWIPSKGYFVGALPTHNGP